MFEPGRASFTSVDLARGGRSSSLRRSRTATTSGSRYDDLNEREALELQRIRTQYNRATSSYRPPPRTKAPPKTLIARCRHHAHRFWRAHICVVVDHKWCRDHLALERTFLAYLRTSLAFSMTGITVAQLFRIQNQAASVFSYYTTGLPLAIVCQGIAIFTLALGACRAYRQQMAMTRGKAYAGGFEINLIGLGATILCVTFFAILIALDVTTEDRPAT